MKPRRWPPSFRRPLGSVRSSIPTRRWRGATTTCCVRMVEEGFISKAGRRPAAARPLKLRDQPTPDRSIAPYFVEDVRKMLEQKYGADALYEAGLRVQTTLDAELQKAAESRRRSRPAPRRQTAQRLPRRPPQHRRRRPRRRALHDRALVAAAARRGHRASPRDRRACARRARQPSNPDRHAHAGHSADGLVVGAAVRRRISSHVGDLIDVELGDDERRRSAVGDARADTRARGGARRHRQPHRRDPCHGRRIQLRPEQVQPRDAGPAAAGLDVQADRLHDGDRPGIHPRLGLRGRARVVRARSQPAAVRADELRPQVRRAR